MNVHIVFTYELDHHKEAVVDSVWDSLTVAYERMMALKKGGFIETKPLLKKGDNVIDQPFKRL